MHETAWRTLGLPTWLNRRGLACILRKRSVTNSVRHIWSSIWIKLWRAIPHELGKNSSAGKIIVVGAKKQHSQSVAQNRMKMSYGRQLCSSIHEINSIQLFTDHPEVSVIWKPWCAPQPPIETSTCRTLFVANLPSGTQSVWPDSLQYRKRIDFYFYTLQHKTKIKLVHVSVHAHHAHHACHGRWKLCLPCSTCLPAIDDVELKPPSSNINQLLTQRVGSHKRAVHSSHLRWAWPSPQHTLDQRPLNLDIEMSLVIARKPEGETTPLNGYQISYFLSLELGILDDQFGSQTNKTEHVLNICNNL